MYARPDSDKTEETYNVLGGMARRIGLDVPAEKPFESTSDRIDDILMFARALAFQPRPAPALRGQALSG